MNDNSKKTVEFEDVEVVKETERAFLVRLANGDEAWVPKSVIHDDSEVFEAEGDGASGTLVLPEWFVEKNGWPG